MRRRDFLQTTGLLTTGMFAGVDIPLHRAHGNRTSSSNEWRELFPRMEEEVFLNAAAGTPLARFSENAIDQYIDYWKYGRSKGRSDVLEDTLSSIRAEFANLINARESEIALVSNTKEGEQIVLDGLSPWSEGRHLLTNVFHFSGSLHNYEGHRRAGRDVRIIRSDGWELDTERMVEAIEDSTSLVCVTLVSNINGRIEDVKSIVEKARKHGALVFADIIQGVGIYPIDVRELGVDFASCSAYKWLYGPHGTGFFFVREELQGSRLPDRLYPGHSRLRFAPWIEQGTDEGLSFSPPSDARRYEPGHHNYMGYASTLAGLRFLKETGLETVQSFCCDLARQLRSLVDQDRFPCISPNEIDSPIIAFEKGEIDIMPALIEANIVISVSDRRFRVSPAIFNNEEDINLLARALNKA
ncbi:MAG: aminotransferase class V-fold PLP-dependent enzyme [Bacteroidetes bacterium]|nr:MAG: aminotransferase class V-fold PLP-dependent enzyme [Bacteroidota bacterium]